jgi:hypothetical protein
MPGRATYNARTGAHDDQRVAGNCQMTGLGLRDVVGSPAELHSSITS